MRINHNIAALNTYRQLNAANNAQMKSMEKLSSGLRINNAADDAAGLAISEKMRGQIRGLEMASKNAQDATSLIQTAEGALNETHAILQRMRELAVQAANDTNTATDRLEIQKEINQLTSEINRIGNTTEFNTQKLLNGEKNSGTVGNPAEIRFDLTGMTGGQVTVLGKEVLWNTDVETTVSAVKNAIINDADLSAKYNVSGTENEIIITAKTNGPDPDLTADLSGATGITNKEVIVTEGKADGAALNFQIGANENQSLTLDISDMRAEALGISTKKETINPQLAVTDGTNNEPIEEALSVLTHEDANRTITTIQEAIDKVSAERSKLGATQNRLEHTINNLATSAENLTAAESRIRDVDMAKELMEQTKNAILSQAAQAMLAQANQLPQGVLQLLR